MPYCPQCGTAYRTGFEVCFDCGRRLVERPPAPPEPEGESWIPIYTGVGLQAEAVEAHLRARGVRVVRVAAEQSGFLPVGFTGATTLQLYTLAVPEGELESRRAEIAAAAQAAAPGPGDPEASAEAEEDFDVRACPACRLWLHDSYSGCPACSAPLVPAVECMTPGQAEPGPVVVWDGPEEAAGSLGDALAGAGFSARVQPLPHGRGGAVQVPWRELISRTGELEGLLP